mmetsp:Transcript_97717/g.280758  ORF Transcript_97717/g.280758 Transcript_97717/m.280758 type:complete len:249 (-) Transcript_97717:299-1045(-)
MHNFVKLLPTSPCIDYRALVWRCDKQCPRHPGQSRQSERQPGLVQQVKAETTHDHVEHLHSVKHSIRNILKAPTRSLTSCAPGIRLVREGISSLNIQVCDFGLFLHPCQEGNRGLTAAACEVQGPMERRQEPTSSPRVQRDSHCRRQLVAVRVPVLRSMNFIKACRAEFAVGSTDTRMTKGFNRNNTAFLRTTSAGCILLHRDILGIGHLINFIQLCLMACCLSTTAQRIGATGCSMKLVKLNCRAPN